MINLQAGHINRKTATGATAEMYSQVRAQQTTSNNRTSWCLFWKPKAAFWSFTSPNCSTLQKEHKEKEASSTEAATGATADISAPTADIPAPTAEAPADDPAATDNQATVELGQGEQDDALQRQYNPKGDPTPMELPPEAQKAKEDADQAALEGEESGEAGQGEPGTADTTNSVQVGHHFV